MATTASRLVRSGSALAVAAVLIATSASADRLPARSLAVEAVLMEPGRSVPACGRVHAISVARFRLVRARTGSMQDAEFWVAFSCRSMAQRDVGRTFQLSLTRARPWSTGAIFWPHDRPVRPLYWALGASAVR